MSVARHIPRPKARRSTGRPPGALAVAPTRGLTLDVGSLAVAGMLDPGGRYIPETTDDKPLAIDISRECETLLALLALRLSDCEMWTTPHGDLVVTGHTAAGTNTAAALSDLLKVWMQPCPCRPGHLTGWHMLGAGTVLVDLPARRVLAVADGVVGSDVCVIEAPHTWRDHDGADVWHSHRPGYGEPEHLVAPEETGRISGDAAAALPRVRAVAEALGYAPGGGR